MSKSFTLGLFVSSTQTLYEILLYRGVCDVARKVGAHVICFTSGALRSYRSFEFQRNVLFDLVNAQNVDGLIISGTLAHPLPIEETLAFFQRYANIPRVSIALAMPGIPNVMVDSQQGIRDLVTHLIQVHQYQKFAFIRGPRGHQEADERFQAFCETLEKHRLTVDENLIVEGDYSINSGAVAMKELFRTAKDYQVIVSANDTMALGAMNVFREAGKSIPEDVAFTGFDDTIEGRFDASPLTTVRQNIYDQGVLAAQLLLDQLAGRPTPEKNTSPTPLIVRRSCGCTGFEQTETSPPAIYTIPWPEVVHSRWDRIQQAAFEKMSHLPPARVAQWIDSWLKAIVADLQGGASRSFFQAMENAQRDGFSLGIELAVWQRALAVFFVEIRACLPPPLQQVTIEVEQEAHFRLGVLAELLENARQIEIEKRDVALREISESLMTTFDLEGVLEVLGAELPRLNVRACYLSLFEDPQHPAELSRLIFGWKHGQRLPLPPEGITFSSRQLLPPVMREALASPGLVIEALYSKEDRLGFILLEVEPAYVAVCNALRALLSGALQGVLLLEQRRKVEEKLLQSQRQLEALVARLEFANRELESFSYSVSHDLRAPLRAINGYAGLLQESLGESLDPTSHILLEKITQSGNKMAQLIDGLLDISRIGRKPLKMEEIDLNALVRSVIEALTPETTSRQITWVPGDMPLATGDPVLIHQVFANLIGNAVKYTGKRDLARIEVGGHPQGPEFVYYVRDNGAGFDMEYAGKLFGVFQRLHGDFEFPGLGIGLATVQRIIHRHGGRIWAEAKVDQGATFYFTLGPLL